MEWIKKLFKPVDDVGEQPKIWGVKLVVQLLRISNGYKVLVPNL